MFAVTRLRVSPAAAPALSADLDRLLASLAARPGFLGGEAGGCAGDPALWARVTRWEGVGAYRRARSAAEVKMAGAPVWLHAVDEPGAYLPPG